MSPLFVRSWPVLKILQRYTKMWRPMRIHHRSCQTRFSKSKIFFLTHPTFPEPNGWATNPPVPVWRIPSSKGEQVYTPRNPTQHTRSAFMAHTPAFSC